MRLWRPRPRALTLHAALFLITLAAAIGCQAQNSLLALDTFPKSHLRIASGTQKHDFDIWLATTPEQQQQGLMFVRDLPANRGMLFLADEPRVFRMWMKNTYIPLDMVFIGANRRIAKIAPNTIPHSLATVSSDAEVMGILEIRGGEAARRGLHVGDEVSWEHPPATSPSP
jgi:hypothetical protein